jgi:NAD/NADP transhydrogenase beta subunit
MPAMLRLDQCLFVNGGKTMGEFILELWSFMKERKKFWLLPILVVLLLFGSLIVLTQGSAVAPFIYTLF